MNEREFAIVEKAAERLARKNYMGRLYEAGDLYAAGWRAVEKYHEKFGDVDAVNEGLLYNFVRYKMLDSIRILRKKDNPVSLDENLAEDLLIDSHSFEADIISQDAFENMIEVLNPKDRSIVRMHIQGGLQLSEIAQVIGVHSSRISQIFINRIYPTLERSLK